VLCAPVRVRDLLVEGRRVVAGGQMVTIDETRIVERQTALARKLRS
jgi:hypothetical protein